MNIQKNNNEIVDDDDGEWWSRSITPPPPPTMSSNRINKKMMMIIKNSENYHQKNKEEEEEEDCGLTPTTDTGLPLSPIMFPMTDASGVNIPEIENENFSGLRTYLFRYNLLLIISLIINNNNFFHHNFLSSSQHIRTANGRRASSALSASCVYYHHRSKRLTMTIMATILAFAIHIFDVCDAKVKIHHLEVPKYIENGTIDSVVLDCQYTIDPREDHNLVVKWFFREDPEPIYQWIVEHDLRRVPERYQGKINPNYRIKNSTEPWQWYRALNLIRPTVEMTGRYSCHVISIISEAHDSRTMIVYAKTKSINLVTRRVIRERNSPLKMAIGHQQPTPPPPHRPQHHQADHPGWPSSSGLSSSSSSSSSRLFGGSTASAEELSSGRSATTATVGRHRPVISVTEIECTVENVYPLPELSIYQLLRDEHHGGFGRNTRPRSLENARIQRNFTQLQNGAFRVSMIVSIDDDDLAQMSSTPSTGYGSTSPAVSDTTDFRYRTKPTMFECLVAQDELKHELRKSTVFVPNLAESWNHPEKSGNQQPIIGIPLLTGFILFQIFLFLVYY